MRKQIPRVALMVVDYHKKGAEISFVLQALCFPPFISEIVNKQNIMRRKLLLIRSGAILKCQENPESYTNLFDVVFARI